MEKKLTAQGPNGRKSYTVTLPIEWIKSENLDKSRSVELNVVGSNIIIRPNMQKDTIVNLNIDEYSNSIVKVIPGLYRNGTDEIKLLFKDSKNLEKTTELIEKKLIGYEIIEQKKNYVVIRDITKESEDDFKVIFRRIFLMILELPEVDDEKQINSIDKNIKKLINYCQRILIKKGHAEFSKIPFYYLILDRLEKICDELVWYLDLKNDKNNELFKEIKKLIRTSYELFYKFDSKTYDFYQHKTYLLKNEIKLKEKMDVSSIHLHNLARILNSLYADIFTLKFDESK